MTYHEEYKKFIEEFELNPKDAVSVGSLIVRMANHFAEANYTYGQKRRAYDIQARVMEFSADENTGKPVSSTKAKVLTDATDEAHELMKSKIDLENIEQMLNALKSLQKGLLQEYSHASTM
jgi:hypothetical protein